jgi:phage tail-like protein
MAGEAGWGSGQYGHTPWGGGVPAAPPAPAAVQFVKSLDLRHVWIQFNASVDPFALQPSPYTFIAQSVPSFNPTVKSARYINGKGIVLNSLVELYLENDLSPGVTYELDILAFTGVPDSTASFVAFAPNWPPTRSMFLWDYVPTINKAEDTSEHLERFILCIQDQLDTTLSAIDNWTNILDLDHAPEAYLDLMLLDLGNPFAFESLTEGDKRALLGMLVKMYQLKGTDPGIKAAVRFFMGFDSQISLFRSSGSLLGSHTVPIDLLNDSFVLGGGGPHDFALTVATTDPAGRALTALESSRIGKIVDVVKPVMSRFVRPIFYGLSAPTRVQIAGNSASVTVSWLQTATVPDNWRVYFRQNAPGVTPFSSARYTQVSGSTTTLAVSTPVGTDAAGSTYYFVLVPYYQTKEGFHSEIEVRNNLSAPSAVVATAGVRSVTVSWAANAAATSYKVYKTLPTTASSSTPLVADFVFEVSGDETSYLDKGLLPGQVCHYCVVARIGDSEGFYSLSVSGTAI